MLTGYVKSDWHYQRPILDRILLWSAKGLRSPLLWLYNVTGRSIPTLQRWESTLWSLAARHMRIQNVRYFAITEETEKSFSIRSLGSKRITVGTVDLPITFSPATTRPKNAYNRASVRSQGRK